MVKLVFSRRRIFILVAGLISFLVLIYFLAGISEPVGNASGTQINPPNKWRSNSVTIFNVGTYNIHQAKGLDGVRDIGRIAKELEGLSIVSLQEVRGPTWFDSADQTQQLGRLLDLGWLFAPTKTRWMRSSSGNGLLSRFEVNSWRIQQLDSTVESSYRNFVVAKILIGSNVVTLINTHIHTDVGRKNQLQTVIEEFIKHDVVVLAGDLNTRRLQSPLKELLADPEVTDAITVALGREPPIWTVDWILTRGLKVLSGKYVEAGASDHPLYSVQLSFLK